MNPAARAAEVVRAMQAEHLSELEEALRQARDAAERATERAQHLQARNEHLQAQLTQEATMRAQAQADLAAERAAREGVVALLTRERETTDTLNERLEQALAAAAKPPAAQPHVEPPVYEMVVSARDVNQRPQRILLTPKKAT